MERNEYCCVIFKEHLDEAGHKGFAIIPFKNPAETDQYVYFLQSRTADVDDDKESRHITIDRAIGCCPWCGTKLTEVTRMNKEAIEEMARRNKRLISSIRNT
jgi:hypothetical protein